MHKKKNSAVKNHQHNNKDIIGDMKNQNEEIELFKIFEEEQSHDSNSYPIDNITDEKIFYFRR